jgi:hypothetical protein
VKIKNTSQEAVGKIDLRGKKSLILGEMQTVRKTTKIPALK